MHTGMIIFINSSEKMCNLQYVYFILKLQNVVVYRIRVYQRHGSLICYVVVDESDKKTVLRVYTPRLVIQQASQSGRTEDFLVLNGNYVAALQF